ncbi:MAG: hypothetical protein ACO28Q_02055 [Ilumatobacteraceae bacterium]|jgi:hypothetical protein
MRMGPAYGWNNVDMAWDSSRTVPWQRLSREWLVYAVVMIVAFLIFLRDTVNGASVLGLAASYPLYLGFGAVLAKFGYQRKTFRDLRNETRARQAPPPSTTTNSRSRPAPTRRTSTGPSQHRKKGKKR